MDYLFDEGIPADTPNTAPIWVERTMPKGVVTNVSVFFPFGCAGLVHVQIYHNEVMVWPTTPGKSYTGNDIEITFSENFKLIENWNLMRVRAWNLDDTFPHTPVVRLSIQPEEVSGLLRLLTGFPSK